MFKGLPAFQDELLTKFAQMHGIVQLAVRDSTIDEILSEGEIAVIRAIANDGIKAFVVYRKVRQNILLCFQSKSGGNIKLPVLQ